MPEHLVQPMAKICTCTICDEGFMNEGLVWLHLRVIHSVTAEVRAVSPHCRIVFTRRAQSFNRYTSPTPESHEYYIYEVRSGLIFSNHS